MTSTPSTALFFWAGVGAGVAGLIALQRRGWFGPGSPLALAVGAASASRTELDAATAKISELEGLLKAAQVGLFPLLSLARALCHGCLAVSLDLGVSPSVLLLSSVLKGGAGLSVSLSHARARAFSLSLSLWVGLCRNLFSLSLTTHLRIGHDLSRFFACVVRPRCPCLPCAARS